MLLSEQELRKIIRKRIINEAHAPDRHVGGTVKDVASGVAVGIGTAATMGAAAGATGVAVGGSAFAGGGLFTGAIGGVAGTLAGLNVWNPIGWTIIGVAAVGATAYFIFGDAKGDELVEQFLSFPDNPKFAEINKMLIDLEKEMEKTNPGAIPPGGFSHRPINQTDITAYIEALYAATKGQFFGTGMGTDEDEILKVFTEIPTLLDVALVAKQFQENYADAWTYDPNLYNVMRNELSDADFKRCVTRPLLETVYGDGRVKPLINLGGRTYTLEEVKKWGQQVEEVKKEAEESLVLIDPNSFDGNLVQKIQAIMNLYSSKKSLGEAIAEDGKWGPKTNKMFYKFLNHVSNNHSIFKSDATFKDFKQGEHSWQSVSGKTIVNYPAYISSTKGCLCFVTDGYNDNVDYGTGKKKIVGGGRSSRTGPSRNKTREETGNEDLSGSMDVSGGLKPSISVTLAGQGKTSLESLGYANGTTSGLAEAVSARVKGNISGGTINLTVVVDRNGIVKSVRLAPGQRRSPVKKQFENLRNVVRRYLEKAGSADNNKIEPSRIRSKVRSKARKFELVLNFPAGRYN